MCLDYKGLYLNILYTNNRIGYFTLNVAYLLSTIVLSSSVLMFVVISLDELVKCIRVLGCSANILI